MGTRKSQVEIKALELLRAGKAMCKYDLAAWAHCDQRTAQRILQRIHKARVGVRIARWVSIYRHWIPVYRVGTGHDSAKPKPLLRAEVQRNRRKDMEVRWQEMMEKRAKRYRERGLSDITLLRRPWNV